MAVGLIAVYSGPLASWASGNILSYIVSDTGLGKRTADELKGLISSLVASGGVVMIPFE